MKDHILVIDEGTTGTRALVFDKQFKIVGTSYTEFTQYTPSTSAVEHDFEEIYDKSVAMCKAVLRDTGLSAGDIACIGITNQRCTYTVWDKKTGKPLRRGLVWQDTRGASVLEKLDKKDYDANIFPLMGIHTAACRANTVLEWLIENDPECAKAIKSGDCCFGTIDTWLIWKLTGGKTFAISSSNASAAGCFDLVHNCWCKPLFDMYGIPMSIMPEIRDETSNFGETDVLGAPIPITGAVADQQSSLFAQNCREAGTAKCTNGTGTFMDINVGREFKLPCTGTDTMVAYTINGVRNYMFEGMLAVTGSAVQWLRDGLGVITASKETEELAASVKDTNGVYFVLSLAGASCPEYDPYARGTIYGISRGTTKAHVVRATLEGIAFGLADIMDAIASATGSRMKGIKIDGGASRNNVLAQMLADYIECDVYRPDSAEATALGAAQLASVGAGIYTVDALPDPLVYDRVFHPEMSPAERDKNLARYRNAVKRSSGWLRD